MSDSTPEEPTTEQLQEPSTEKEPDEVPEAEHPDDPEPSHHAIGIGVIDSDADQHREHTEEGEGTTR